MKIIPSGKTLGVANMLVGALMIFGGLQEAIAYFGEQPVNVIVGSLAAVSSSAFLVSGFALWRRKSYADMLTAFSCVAVIVMHVASWQFRFLGVPAIVLAIIYPMLVLLSLWRSRGNAAPASQQDAPSQRDRRGGFLKRARVSHAV